MPRSPGSQTHAMMQQKSKLAAELLTRGLTVRQISLQLNCSEVFVRRVRRGLQMSDGKASTPSEGVER
jgi:DNA-binding NarL/FixJ family response regulator